MISAGKLMNMARKWRKIAALGRKRISYPGKIEEAAGAGDYSSDAAEKGRFVVYASDGARFSFPIAYLGSLILRELLRMAEEEFGHPSDGPITLPCDSEMLRYVANLMEKKDEDVERALLLSMADCRSSSNYSLQQRRQQTCRQNLLSVC